MSLPLPSSLSSFLSSDPLLTWLFASDPQELTDPRGRPYSHSVSHPMWVDRVLDQYRRDRYGLGTWMGNVGVGVGNTELYEGIPNWRNSSGM